jgi:hypothetical protein
MLLDIFLSVTSLCTSSIPKLPSPTLMQYLMLLTMGGTAVTLSKKQLRKMKWEIVKNYVKNMFKRKSKKPSGNGKVGLWILMIILLVGLGWLLWFLLFGIKKL